MNVLVAMILFLVVTQTQAACRCTCVLSDSNLCASAYDLDDPCPSICPAAVPMGGTACPLTQVFNPRKGIYEWKALCVE